MDTILLNLRIGLRMLAKRPGLAAGRLLTVLIIVAAGSAVFTVANVTLLRPLPYPHPDRLLRIYLQPPGTTDFRDANPLHPIAFRRVRARARLFEQVEGIWAVERAITGGGDPESVDAGRVSPGYFAILGGQMVLGRTFTEEECAANAPVVVLSHGFWMRRFGGDPAALGQVVEIDRVAHTIVGVVAPRFASSFAPSEFWTPLDPVNAPDRMAASFIQTAARLRPGVTPAQGSAELEGIMKDTLVESPQILKGWTIHVKDLREAQYGSQRPAILMLLVAVAGLALIATANLANLTLADVMFRRGDFAVRAALGASRSEIVAPEIAQSVLLALMGATAGLLVAWRVAPALVTLDPSSGLAGEQLAWDWRVLSSGFGLASAVMFAAVAVPALRLSSGRLASDVTTGSRRAIGGRAAARVRLGLVIAQTALALVLLSCGALVVTTLFKTGRIDPGFDPGHVLTGQLRLPASLFPADEDRARFVDQVVERLRATPGVIDAATTLNRFKNGLAFQTLVQVEGRPTADGQPYTVQYRRITPHYFRTMRIALLSGRDFDRHDWVGAASVAIVSRGFARRFWPGEDAVGKRIKRGSTATDWTTIVGVVEDVRDVSLATEPIDTVYTSYYQASNAAAPVGLVVRTAGDPAAAADTIKRAIWAIDAKQPLANVVTLDRFLADSLGPQRFRAILVTVCGVIGLLLATIGTYGVTARAVVERTREVGIRLALGGTPSAVWWTIASGSLRAVVFGAVTGTLASVLAGAGIRALLPEIAGTSWVLSAAAGGALLLIGAAAAMMAARAATAIEPLRALQRE